MSLRSKRETKQVEDSSEYWNIHYGCPIFEYFIQKSKKSVHLGLISELMLLLSRNERKLKGIEPGV
jgi:hypothetical protein